MKNWIKYILVVLIMALSASALSAKSLTIEMKEAGTFQETIGDQLKEIDSLTIVGPFNRADFEALKPAWDIYRGNLQYLNLYRADLEDKTIPQDCFYTARKEFKNVVLPPDLRIIEGAAFSTSYIELNELPEELEELGDAAFYSNEGITHIKMPQTCQNLGAEIFFAAHNLESIVFPEGITVIKYKMCSACTSLQYVYLPNSVREIEDNAFTRNFKLKAINLPEDLEILGVGAFLDTGLENLVLPPKLKEIKAGALNSIVGSLYSKAPVPPVCEDRGYAKYDVFSDYNKTLYVPVGCAEAYRNAPVWCNFKDIRETYDFPVAGVTAAEKAEPLHVTAGTGYLIIHADTEQADYAVYDAAGQLKATGCATADTRIDLPAGIYVVTMAGHTAKARVR